MCLASLKVVLAEETDGLIVFKYLDGSLNALNPHAMKSFSVEYSIC